MVDLPHGASGSEETLMAARIEPLLTVADLDACPDDNNRYELIRGELFVSRAPGLPHQIILHNLQVALADYLRLNPIGKIVPGAGAVFSEYDAVIPDLVFVRNERWTSVIRDNKFSAAPDLVVEILSPGKENRNRDLLVKRQLYGQYGVSEYWTVDAENRMVDTYRLENDHLVPIKTFRDIEHVTTELLPGLQLSVSSLLNI
jgi:Uma2 family endonuclease